MIEIISCYLICFNLYFILFYFFVISGQLKDYMFAYLLWKWPHRILKKKQSKALLNKIKMHHFWNKCFLSCNRFVLCLLKWNTIWGTQYSSSNGQTTGRLFEVNTKKGLPVCHMFCLCLRLSVSFAVYTPILTFDFFFLFLFLEFLPFFCNRNDNVHLPIVSHFLEQVYKNKSQDKVTVKHFNLFTIKLYKILNNKQYLK